jgi:hypothetical protein
VIVVVSVDVVTSMELVPVVVVSSVGVVSVVYVVPVVVSSVDVVSVFVVSSGIVVSSVINVVSSVVEGYGQSFSGSVAGQFNVRFPLVDADARWKNSNQLFNNHLYVTNENLFVI